MWQALELVASSLDFSIGNIILLIVGVGSLIFCAKDFRLGAVILTVTTGVCFMWFYSLGWLAWKNALTVMIMGFVLMSISLYAHKYDTPGGII